MALCRVRLTELNPHIICALCSGYFVEATTIIECLHTFCKTCIVRYLENSSFCPICDAQVHKTKPLLSLREDRTLQDVVYKLVPGLFHSEVQRRVLFYKGHPEVESDRTQQALKERRHFFHVDDQLSLSLEYLPPAHAHAHLLGLRPLNDPLQQRLKVNGFKKSPDGEGGDGREKTPSTDDSEEEVDIVHNGDCLAQELTLLDVVYMYKWTEDEPLRLLYTVIAPPPSMTHRRPKRQKSKSIVDISKEEEDSSPPKIPKLEKNKDTPSCNEVFEPKILEITNILDTSKDDTDEGMVIDEKPSDVRSESLSESDTSPKLKEHLSSESSQIESTSDEKSEAKLPATSECHSDKTKDSSVPVTSAENNSSISISTLSNTESYSTAFRAQCKPVTTPEHTISFVDTLDSVSSKPSVTSVSSASDAANSRTYVTSSSVVGPSCNSCSIPLVSSPVHLSPAPNLLTPLPKFSSTLPSAAMNQQWVGASSKNHSIARTDNSAVLKGENEQCFTGLKVNGSTSTYTVNSDTLRMQSVSSRPLSIPTTSVTNVGHRLPFVAPVNGMIKSHTLVAPTKPRLGRPPLASKVTNLVARHPVIPVRSTIDPRLQRPAHSSLKTMPSQIHAFSSHRLNRPVGPTSLNVQNRLSSISGSQQTSPKVGLKGLSNGPQAFRHPHDFKPQSFVSKSCDVSPLKPIPSTSQCSTVVSASSVKPEESWSKNVKPPSKSPNRSRPPNAPSIHSIAQNLANKHLMKTAVSSSTSSSLVTTTAVSTVPMSVSTGTIPIGPASGFSLQSFAGLPGAMPNIPLANYMADLAVQNLLNLSAAAAAAQFHKQNLSFSAVKSTDEGRTDSVPMDLSPTNKVAPTSPLNVTKINGILTSSVKNLSSGSPTGKTTPSSNVSTQQPSVVPSISSPTPEVTITKLPTVNTSLMSAHSTVKGSNSSKASNTISITKRPSSKLTLARSPSNASLRHIPNPSLLSQQSEARNNNNIIKTKTPKKQLKEVAKSASALTTNGHISHTNNCRKGSGHSPIKDTGPLSETSSISKIEHMTRSLPAATSAVSIGPGLKFFN